MKSRNVIERDLDTKLIFIQGTETDSGPLEYMKGSLEGVLCKCNSFLDHGRVKALQGSNVPAEMARSAAQLG